MAKAKRDPIPQAVRFDVFRRDNFTCRYCGKASGEGVTLHVDHVHAVARGGNNDLANLVTACSDCNYGKGAKAGVRPPAVHGGKDALVGYFGHRLDADGHIRNQFEIVRKVSEEMYAIQLFSYIDGRPTNVEVVSLAELRSQNMRLYSSEYEWALADCKNSYDRDVAEFEATGFPTHIPSVDERLGWRLKNA